MSRWARRIFLLLTSLGAVVTCVFWWRSHRFIDELDLAGFTETHQFRLTAIDSACGVLSFRRIEVSPDNDALQREIASEYGNGWNLRLSQVLTGDPWRSEWTDIGFEFGSVFSRKPVNGVIYLRLPHWFVAGFFCVPWVGPVVRKLKKARRRNRGQCQTCGYDLRCSFERCPECGTRIPRKETSDAT